jgi:SAM-dependent methyltransferase
LIDSGIELQPFLFDVTDRYVDYWKSFPPPTSWSVHEPDQRWYGTMDVLVSFFALEHIPCLRRTLKDMRALLRDGGKLYFVVPNVYSNAADFIVADHVNHFSPLSIEFLLKSQGFSEIEVDAKVHDSAFVVVASKSDYEDTKGTPAPDTSILKEAASGLACFWNESVERIRNFEDSIDAKQFAIYGAGFYGNMIAHNIKNRDRIACFIDRNVNIQRTIFEDIPIYRPEELPANISDLIVGLNPSIARDSIESTVAFKHRKLNCFYL